MKHTVIALFDLPEQARKAADALAGQGFAAASVHVADPSAAGSPPADAPHAEPLPAAVAIEGGPAVGLLHRLAVLFGVDDEPHVGHYAEAVRRGGTVVQVDADGETQAATARDALLALGAVNIDDRVEAWRAGGWEGAAGAGAPDAAGTARSVTEAGSEGALSEGARVRGVAVHRQEVSIGGVRVYGHSAVHVFGDDDAADFRADHATRHAAQGGGYDDYDPAYRYGHGLASDARFQGRDWDEIESDVRGDWETRHPGSAWERFKGAVRHAWARATR